MCKSSSAMIALARMRCTAPLGVADGRVCLDALGLAEKGKAHELVANGDITFGGKYLVNPSGGLISKGHPIGATGLAQASELVLSTEDFVNCRYGIYVAGRPIVQNLIRDTVCNITSALAALS